GNARPATLRKLQYIIAASPDLFINEKVRGSCNNVLQLPQGCRPCIPARISLDKIMSLLLYLFGIQTVTLRMRTP
ncbi:MAG: hypothetical protein Q8R31_00335, partial [Candidatus Omnitrophota bacterium]|nr:hypothetical protein [Candidatus Omnitrophota bacterium]